jgi:glyoxylase-like metal-dependent hydrolase (beta-lactamase superfamily II)
MHAICATCGTQFAETRNFPESCPICLDERQYVGLHGQQWSTLEDLRKNHKTVIVEEEENLLSFSIEPRFGIGQRAFLIRTPEGNVLWDCLSLFDGEAIKRIKEFGRVTAIAISHPHYYTCMVEWSRQLGDVSVYLHEADKTWVMRPDPCIHYWDGEQFALPGGLTVIRCSGHFDGACVLHWKDGASGGGALLSADTIQVVPDRSWVSFMYSYPNYVPLPAQVVSAIAAKLDDFAFERIYGAFPDLTVASDGKGAIRRSVERYLKALQPR